VTAITKQNTIFPPRHFQLMVQGGGVEPHEAEEARRAIKKRKAPPPNPKIGGPVLNPPQPPREKWGGPHPRFFAMARTMEPHSASAQFFINVATNDFLSTTAPPTVQGWGTRNLARWLKAMDVGNKDSRPYYSIARRPRTFR